VTPPVAPRTVQAGVAQLELPSGWERLARPPALPGLEGGVGVRGASTDVVIATLPATRPSLLPEALVAAAGGQVPAPRPLRLGARSAWAYELPGPVPVAAVVSPTTAGVVTLACTGAAGAVPAMDACETAARAVVLVGAAPLEPRPETAAATALPRMIARLNGRRRTARAALAATRSPQRRARAARSVATAYGAAARRIAPLAAGDAAAVRRTLAALAGRYRALAAASAARLPTETRRAGSAIRRGERRLAGLLRALPPPVGE
jgi:hypothetical protein